MTAPKRRQATTDSTAPSRDRPLLRVLDDGFHRLEAQAGEALDRFLQGRRDTPCPVLNPTYGRCELCFQDSSAGEIEESRW